MRYEKKFRISKSEFPIFVSLVNKLKFKVHYESRFISSIYYDTVNFNLYRDSINGVSQRRKYRARFYNDNSEEINFEEKIKIADLGYKKIHSKKDLKNINKIKLFFMMDKKCKYVHIPTRFLKIYYPVSFINYFRSYFISYDNKIRITYDEKINYSKIINYKKDFSLGTKIPDLLGVIEIKYDEENITSKNVILDLTSCLNFHLSRNSKYCNSIECLF